jgi:putative GTP pyrophosphokinase
MASTKEDFFRKYHFEQSVLDSAPSWDVLHSIGADHETRREVLEESLELITRRLMRIPQVHSTRGRIKDADHLVEKCIRKGYRDLHCSNYTEKVTDLAGARALHLYKSDWQAIHQAICKWDTIGKPLAYYRAGDDIQAFEQAGCETKVHPSGYRSVHYLVNVQMMEVKAVVEVQVRTLFEEAWSEIDHSVRYPYGSDPAVSRFLALFNRIAGTADEMGEYVEQLRGRLEGLQSKTSQEIARRDEAIRLLETQLSHVKNTSAEEKRQLQSAIEELRRPTTVETIAKALGAFSAGAAEMLVIMAAQKSYLADPLQHEGQKEGGRQSGRGIVVGPAQATEGTSHDPPKGPPSPKKPSAKKG